MLYTKLIYLFIEEMAVNVKEPSHVQFPLWILSIFDSIHMFKVPVFQLNTE